MIPSFKTPYKINKPTILRTSTASFNTKHLRIRSSNDIFSKAKLSLRLKQEFKNSRNPQERTTTLTITSKPSNVISSYNTVSRSTSTLPIKHKHPSNYIIPSIYLRSPSLIYRLNTITKELSNILRKLDNKPLLSQPNQTIKVNRTPRLITSSKSRNISKRNNIHKYPTLDYTIKRPFL